MPLIAPNEDTITRREIAEAAVGPAVAVDHPVVRVAEVNLVAAVAARDDGVKVADDEVAAFVAVDAGSDFAGRGRDNADRVVPAAAVHHDVGDASVLGVVERHRAILHVERDVDLVGRRITVELVVACSDFRDGDAEQRATFHGLDVHYVPRLKCKRPTQARPGRPPAKVASAEGQFNGNVPFATVFSVSGA